MEATAVATWTRQSPSIWAYPTILTLHSIGLGIVVGASAVVDFRMLGFARRLRISDLTPLFAIIWWAFALNAASGVLLFMADATRKSTQTIFFVKLAFIAAAVVTVAMTKRRIDAGGDGAPDVPSNRALAFVTLLCWIGAIAAGRFMAYL